MADLKAVRLAYGLPAPLNGTEQRLDLLIAVIGDLAEELSGLCRLVQQIASAELEIEMQTEVDIDDTVELTEPGRSALKAQRGEAPSAEPVDLAEPKPAPKRKPKATD